MELITGDIAFRLGVATSLFLDFLVFKRLNPFVIKPKLPLLYCYDFLLNSTIFLFEMFFYLDPFKLS